jgi:cytochrome c553
MQHHYLQVTLVHDALIRGDLTAMRAPARELAEMPTPAGVPVATLDPLVQLTILGRRAASATSLKAAASDVAGMLLQCGHCHRTSGIRPSPAESQHADIGGIVGHMLEHQRAVDELLVGLITPSDSSWSQGTDRLQTATLRTEQLPSDPKWTSEIRQAEKRVHDLAHDAAAATTDMKRADVYAQLLTTCAACHSLHARIWGPTPG